MNRSMGRKIRKFRKQKGLKTRDSSIGINELIKNWARNFVNLMKGRANFGSGSLARKIIPVQQLPDAYFLNNGPVIVKK